MKYFSINTVTSAYKSNVDRTKNKFWGLLAIMSSIDSIARPGVRFDFSTKKVSTFLEQLFSLEDTKKVYPSDSTWNIMFSKKWTSKLPALMFGRTPNIYDVIVWYFRRQRFEDSVSNSDLISLFLQKANISIADAKALFDMSEKTLQYSGSLYKESDLFKALKLGGKNITAEGNSVVASPGELSRAPFIQTLYAGQGIQECVIITTFKFNDLYGGESADLTPKSIPEPAIDCTRYIKLLKEKKNLVLTGAPGTGKTHLAKTIAKQMNAVTQFVQFHPSYDYTDFVEGLRPVLTEEVNSNQDKEVRFKRRDGIFKHFCKDAIKDLKEMKSGKPYVFIIDEINRGEISKVFGELFFALDPGYRGEKGRVITQYQELITDCNDTFKDGFYVPDNVFIIGTMNDIDRSVESMDFAIRRRFAWKEVTAEESAVNMKLPPEVRTRMDKLNAAIRLCDGLSDAYCIGGAYFLKLKDNDYDALWENHIKGVIEEYFRGNPSGPENVNAIRQAFLGN